MKKETKKKRRKRRSGKEIEKLIDDAALGLIESSGYNALMITNIVEEANIEPIVFYNRYTNMDEYIDVFVRRYDYWFSDVTKGVKDKSLTEKESYKLIIKNIFTELDQNKAMQQLLRWELYNENKTSQRTIGLRQFATIPVINKYKKYFKDNNSPVEIDVMSAIIIAGIYYLILHSESTTFAGVDITTQEGKERLCNAIDFLADHFFDFNPTTADTHTINIARNMKSEGISLEIIERCTGLPLDTLQQI